MKDFLRFAALSLFIFSALQAAEYEVRTWTSTVGSTIEAKLIERLGSSATLEREDGSRLTVKLSQLSTADRHYVDNLPEKKGKTSIAGIAAQPGKISQAINCESDSNWNYHLYLPKDFHDAREWPVMFVMSPGGGKGGGGLKRYIDAAETFGCILAISVESKNGFDKSTEAMNAMVEDVHDRMPVIESLSFASGMSGGSRMAYYLAELNRNIQGVIACGSGSGIYTESGDFRDAKLRSSTYVYSLIGSNCFNRTGAYNSHEDFPAAYRLRYFIGGHAWAPAPLINEAMARVMGEALKDYQGADKDDLRERYAKTATEMAEAMESNQPWEAYYLSEFISKFPTNRETRSRASSLASRLEGNEKVQLAMDAEDDIKQFGRQFFRDVFYKQDKGENRDRLKKAERLAEEYASIPHGELIRKLGDGS